MFAMINAHFRTRWAPLLTICTLLLLLFVSQPLAADSPQTPSPTWNIEMGIELPIEKTPWEIEHEHLFPIIYPTDEPPPQPAVNPAEWEPMTGVLIRYPLAVPLSLVAEMAEDVEVMTIVASQSQQQTAYNQYNNYGVNMENCTWLIAPTNTVYTRDYGPWYIFDGEGNQGIIDHIYNRPRPADDQIPAILGETLGIPVYGLPLIHTGGNYMSDGMGVGMSTRLVLAENPELSAAEVDSIMLEYLGLSTYHKLEYIESGGIHHIDCWAKLLDPGRILVKRLDPVNPLLEERAEYLATVVSSYGRPYEVIRIDCVSSTPYTNALILNDKVLVPLFSHYLDQQAMETWEEAMPGYEVLGFYGSWYSNDALHCRTMGMTDRYMLRIVHVPLGDRENTGEDYLVQAVVHPYSNMSLLPGSPEVLWKAESGPYTSVTMTYAAGDTYTGYIPEQPDGEEIYYYLSADDESGRHETHPYIGPGNPHHFYVGPDTIPPTIVHDPITGVPLSHWPATVSATVTDNTGIDSVHLQFAINGIAQPQVVMDPVGDDLYEGTFTGSVSQGDSIWYRIRAKDSAVIANVSFHPPSGYHEFEIVGQMPIYIWEADTSPITGPALAAILDSLGIAYEQGTALPSYLDAYQSLFICLGVYPNNHVLTQDEVDRVIAFFEGSGKVYMEGADCWAYDPLYPTYNPYFGIEGTSDGSADLYTVLGEAGTFTEGMSFSYAGENNYIDHIEPISPGPDNFRIFRNQDDGAGCGVAFDATQWQSVGVSFEFGGLVDGASPSTKAELLWEILCFLGLAEETPVTIELVPDATVVARGDTLSYTAELVNQTEEDQTFYGRTEVVLPGGGHYPLLGPIQITLSPGQVLQRHIEHVVPGNAPLGDYDYVATIGLPPDQVYDEDSFEFTVVEP